MHANCSFKHTILPLDLMVLPLDLMVLPLDLMVLPLDTILPSDLCSTITIRLIETHAMIICCYH